MARSYGQLAMSRRVMVNLDDGSAIEGILWDQRKPLLVLRDARLHSAGGSAPLDGEVIVDAARILFMQVIS